MHAPRVKPVPITDQLHMIWPERLLHSPPTPTLPAGYALRQYRGEDEDKHAALMRKAGFEQWNESLLQSMLRMLIPGGLFVVEHEASREIVATAMAVHRPTLLHPQGGELGWVAAHPEHRGKGLGLAVSATAVNHFLGAGYTRIYLCTDDWRLAAIKTYLKLGFEPFYHGPGAEARWAKILPTLAWPS